MKKCIYNAQSGIDSGIWFLTVPILRTSQWLGPSIHLMAAGSAFTVTIYYHLVKSGYHFTIQQKIEG